MRNPSPNTSGLQPPWTSETAPKGRKNAGLSLIEYINEMSTWSKDEVEAVRDNEKKPLIQRRAAERLLDDKDVWELVDHTNHRPLTKSDVTHHDDQPRTESERAEARDNVLARIRGRITRAS